MKSKILIVGAMLGTVVIEPAMAVTKCVALNSSTTCLFKNPGYNVADWTSECTANGVSVLISGIGICSATEPDGYSVSDTVALEISSAADENQECWCKMTSPAVSSIWVHNSNGSGSFCLKNCAYYCASMMRLNASFRARMFSALGD